MDDCTTSVEDAFNQENSPMSSHVMMVDFPEELLANVLAFLPISNLFRFRSVCKNWNGLVKDPLFRKTWASNHGGGHFLFYHEFIKHVFKCLAIKKFVAERRNVNIGGGDAGFVLLQKYPYEFQVIDLANVCLKKIPCLDPAYQHQYAVGMVVHPGTRNYSIFVGSKICRQNRSLSESSISVHQYDSTQDAWRLAWEIPPAPLERIGYATMLLNFATHQGSHHFLIKGISHSSRGHPVFRVTHDEKGYQRRRDWTGEYPAPAVESWENLVGGFPIIEEGNIPLLFEHDAKLFLAALSQGRYSIWQYDDEAAKWSLFDTLPQEFTGTHRNRYSRALFRAQCRGNLIYVGKWMSLDLPVVIVYNLVDRQYKEMSSSEVERELVQIDGRFLQRFLFQPVD